MVHHLPSQGKLGAHSQQVKSTLCGPAAELGRKRRRNILTRATEILHSSPAIAPPMRRNPHRARLRFFHCPGTQCAPVYGGLAQYPSYQTQPPDTHAQWPDTQIQGRRRRSDQRSGGRGRSRHVNGLARLWRAGTSDKSQRRQENSGFTHGICTRFVRLRSLGYSEFVNNFTVLE